MGFHGDHLPLTMDPPPGPVMRGWDLWAASSLLSVGGCGIGRRMQLRGCTKMPQVQIAQVLR